MVGDLVVRGVSEWTCKWLRLSGFSGRVSKRKEWREGGRVEVMSACVDAVSEWAS